MATFEGVDRVGCIYGAVHFAELTYGGKMEDEWDMRTLTTFLEIPELIAFFLKSSTHKLNSRLLANNE